MFVFFECCVLSGRGLCDVLINRPETVLTSAVCLSVIEEPHRGGLGPLRLSSHWREGGNLEINVCHR